VGAEERPWSPCPSSARQTVWVVAARAEVRHQLVESVEAQVLGLEYEAD
jgi:hypothetical protein